MRGEWFRAPESFAERESPTRQRRANRTLISGGRPLSGRTNPFAGRGAFQLFPASSKARGIADNSPQGKGMVLSCAETGTCVEFLGRERLDGFGAAPCESDQGTTAGRSNPHRFVRDEHPWLRFEVSRPSAIKPRKDGARSLCAAGGKAFKTDVPCEGSAPIYG